MKSIEFKIEQAENLDVDLLLLSRQLEEEIDIALDSATEKTIKKEREVTMVFLDKLKNQKEKFKSVFETGAGSMYFLANNGESWRFKKDGENFKNQAICKKIIFINEEEKEKLLNLMNSGPLLQEILIDYKIKKTEIMEGTYPLEIGVKGFPDVVFEEDQGTIRIIGTKNRDGKIYPSFASGIHLGHQITEIIR